MLRAHSSCSCSRGRGFFRGARGSGASITLCLLAWHFPKKSHLIWISMFNMSLTLSLNFWKSWSQFLCHGCDTVAFVFTNQTTSTVLLEKTSQHCYSHIHSLSLLSGVLALGNSGYKGHQTKKHKFFSHANFITALWGDHKRYLCIAASYGKRIFSIVLKQKQKQISPWEEGQKDSWHGYFGISCSAVLILQELAMENIQQNAFFPSRRISLTEWAIPWSRNRLAKEHQGLGITCNSKYAACLVPEAGSPGSYCT